MRRHDSVELPRKARGSVVVEQARVHSNALEGALVLRVNHLHAPAAQWKQRAQKLALAGANLDEASGGAELVARPDESGEGCVVLLPDLAHGVTVEGAVQDVRVDVVQMREEAAVLAQSNGERGHEVVAARRVDASSRKGGLLTQQTQPLTPLTPLKALDDFVMSITSRARGPVK